MRWVPEHSPLENSQCNVMLPALMWTYGLSRCWSTKAWRLTSIASVLRATEVRGSEGRWISVLRDICHGEQLDNPNTCVGGEWRPICKFRGMVGTVAGRDEGWYGKVDGKMGGNRVVSVCHVFCLPVNQLNLWGRMKAAPLGITQIKAPRCLESYILYCVWQALLSWKQVFQLLQRLNTTREKEKKKKRKRKNIWC